MKYQLYLVWCIFLLTLAAIDFRNFFCKKSITWSISIISVGSLMVASSVLLNCYFAYIIEGYTNLRYDLEVIIDTLKLQKNKKNEYIFFWRTTTFGYSLIVGGFEIFIVCKLLKKGLIPPKKRREKKKKNE